MKNKKFFAFFIILLFIFAIGGIFFFVKKVMHDVDTTNRRIVEIGNLYRNMDSYISDYNDNRDGLRVLTKDAYIDNLDSKYDNILLILNKENDNVKSISNVVLNLDKDCNGRIYSDAYVNQVCLSYKSHYEEMVNVFVGDISHVNKMIRLYNDSHDHKLNEYVSSNYQEYVDYNKDGVYSGKEE